MPFRTRAAPISTTFATRPLYLCAGALLVAWPGATQKIFMDRAFVGDEAGLIRVMGLMVAVIGWLYFFGGRSDARQIVAASVVERLLFVPVVLGSLAIAGVFPHLLGRSQFSTQRSPLVPGVIALAGRDGANR